MTSHRDLCFLCLCVDHANARPAAPAWWVGGCAMTGATLQKRYIPRSPSRSPAFVTARLSAAAVTGLDLRRFLVDAGDDLVGDPQQLHSRESSCDQYNVRDNEWLRADQGGSWPGGVLARAAFDRSLSRWTTLPSKPPKVSKMHGTTVLPLSNAPAYFVWPEKAAARFMPTDSHPARRPVVTGPRANLPAHFSVVTKLSKREKTHTQHTQHTVHAATPLLQDQTRLWALTQLEVEYEEGLFAKL